ncbi:MAG: hypothetical protein ACLS5S_09275, partial [Faecalibacterium sp.]
MFHNRPLSVKISSFYLTIIPPHCNRIFLQKVSKSPPGHGRFKMPSACALGIIQGNITLDFGRTERLRAFRSTIFTRRVAMVNCICSAASFGSAALRSALLFAFTASPVKKWFRATRRAFPIIFYAKSPPGIAARRALVFTVYSALVSGFASALASG